MKNSLSVLSEWCHFHLFESESHSVSLFLSESVMNFTLNRVESTHLSLQKELSAIWLFARVVWQTKQVVFHSFTLREHDGSRLNSGPSRVLKDIVISWYILNIFWIWINILNALTRAKHKNLLIVICPTAVHYANYYEKGFPRSSLVWIFGYIKRFKLQISDF